MELQEALEIVSYKIGLRFGESVLGDELFLDEKIHEAILDKAAGSEQCIDLKAYMQATKIVSAERTQLGKIKNEQFLIKNSQQENIQSTPSGLQYEVLLAGEGNSPQEDDTVTVHYTGQLIDGTIFDTSHERGKPARFAVKKVIAGWTEALQLMNVGETYRIFIPQDLAYGENGGGSDIPPFSTLIFDLELINIDS